MGRTCTSQEVADSKKVRDATRGGKVKVWRLSSEEKPPKQTTESFSKQKRPSSNADLGRN
jgi:hypothetical protein